MYNVTIVAGARPNFMKIAPIIHEINKAWHATESKLQVGIDPRVYAYSALNDERFSSQIKAHFRLLNGRTEPSKSQLYNATERFLLPVCPDSCQECLTAFNRYNDFGISSRELSNLWLGLKTHTIRITNPNDDWMSEVSDKILDASVVAIQFSRSISDSVLNQLNELFATEVEVGILLYPISIQRVEKSGNDWVVTLQLKDLIHG